MWRALPLAALGLVAAGPALAGPAPARFALVVGNNHPLPGSGYETLQYADDDALRFAAFMTEIGASVRLFTGPDEATAERFGALAQQARPPRRDDVLQAIADLQADLQAVRDRPREVFVYFSGHGSVSSSQAFLHLLDGPFTRTDMRSALLERLDAERLHVIVDSCHAYFMVNPRGQRVPTDDDDDDGGLDRYPRVGFLLSTSARKEVQEWSGYEAGVFSHQLLGALRGAADVDRDGKVTYAEAHAYVVAANSGVQNPAARVQPFVRRPAVGAPVLLDLSSAPDLPRLELPPDPDGHLFVMDGHGQRLLDAHKARGQRLSLVVPPDPALLVWFGPTPWGRDEAGTLRPLADPEARPPVSARGPVADELREHLFLRPLTPEFVAGLDAAVSFRAVPDLTTAVGRQPGLRPVSVGLLAGGGAALAVGAVAAVVFAKARAAASPAVYTAENAESVRAARDRAELSRAVMVGGLAAGGVAVGAALLYELVGGGS